MPSSLSTLSSTPASGSRVSRLQSPASIRRRGLSVSSKVMFPELPDASMDTRKPIAFPQYSATNFQNHRRAQPWRQRNSIGVVWKFFSSEVGTPTPLQSGGLKHG